MKALFLLIVLTQNGAGDINASFVNTQSLAQCKQKAELVSSVFNASSIAILESQCVESDLQFTSFEHASTSRLINNFYLITIGDGDVLIETIANWRNCVTQAKIDVRDKKHYCASSVQSPRE